MFCKNCGEQLAEGAKFCGKCGTKVVDISELIQSPSAIEIPVQVPSATPAGRKKKVNKAVVIAGIAVVIIIALTVAFVATGGVDRVNVMRQLNLGNRYLEDMEYEKAIVAFTKAIEIDPNCVEAYLGRGDAYMGLGGEENIFLALADYRMVLALDETCTDAYLSIADIYITQERYDAAYNILQLGLKEVEDRQRIQNKIDDIPSGEDNNETENVSEAVEEPVEEPGKETVEEPEEETDKTDTVEDLMKIENAVYVGSGQELENLLRQGASNCTLVLDGIDYNVNWLYMSGAENVTIYGITGTRIISSSGEDTVLSIDNCKEIVLKNLVMGHDISIEGACTEGVLSIYGSEVSIVNCDLFGCGLIGIYAGKSTFEVENTVIRDCSESIMTVYDTTADFNNCSFTGNGYKNPRMCAIDIWEYEMESMLSFSECTFSNNQNPSLVEEERKESLTFDSCIFTGNTWD